MSSASPDGQQPVELSRRGLRRPDVVTVARDGTAVTIGGDAREAIAASARIVADYAAGETPVYGISTGFGSLATTVIPPERREELQRGLIRSHAAGIGPAVEDEVVRAMMLLRARTLAMGFSGARPVVVETIVKLLNAGITPTVPEHGSLGCSGDLAPLAHVALALIGEGECVDAMAAAGIEPITLQAKEGLALINGTDGMLGMLVLALSDLDVLLRSADVAAAMSVEALMGTDRAFAADLMALRPHPGQTASAANLVRLLDGSPIVASHRTDDPRVQDAYSLRCTPQVHGAARDAVATAASMADIELRSAIDNPSVLPDGRVESCGHFHGAPVGYQCDFLAIASRGRRCDRRTADRPAARPHPVPRPPAVSRRGRRSQLRADDRAVHAGGDGVGEPSPRNARERRLDPVVGDAGGPRLDGVGRSAEAAVFGRQPRTDHRLRARVRGPRPRAAGADRAGRGDRGRRRRAARRRRRRSRPGPLAGPELAAAEQLVMSGGLVAAVEAVTGPLQAAA